MGQRRIKRQRRRCTPAERPALSLVQMLRRYGPLTWALNDELEKIMTDTRRSDVDRVEASLIRHSWGNWCSCAVECNPERPDLSPPDDLVGEVQKLRAAFAPLSGPCPLCEQEIPADDARAAGLNWHRLCIVYAYARDAIAFGGSGQRKWGKDMLEIVDRSKGAQA